MKEHKYYTNWEEFWDFYITSVKQDIGTKKFSVIKNNSSRITKKLERISDEFRIATLEPLIRKAGMVPQSVSLYYDPSATTFYSAYSKERKVFYIGYPTFTKYMCFWEPAMKASFRHEMGHILRGDCLLSLSYSQIRNANSCMDIRINHSLERESLLQVFKCLFFKDLEEDYQMLIPKQQFPKIDLPYDEENPYVPEWVVIADKFNKANERKKKENENKSPKDENKKESFEIGDYVIIDKKSSQYDGEPGVIVDIDEKGNFVVDAISDEEFDNFLNEVKKSREQSMNFVKTDENIGVYTDKEIISAIPEEEGEQGEYGDEGDDEPQSGGGEESEEKDGEGEESGENGGGGEDSGNKGDNKSPEEIIKEKEEILEDLKNGGVDGENQGDGVWSDELTEKDKTEKSEGKDGDKTEKESDEKGDDEKTNGEDKDSDTEGKKVDEWTQEQIERKKDRQDQINEIRLTNKIKSSINNFKSIKAKHEGKLSKGEMLNIDKALAELENLI